MSLKGRLPRTIIQIKSREKKDFGAGSKHGTATSSGGVGGEGGGTAFK